MIRFSLACAAGHSFDSWFKSAGAFDALERAGRLDCPVCGGTEVRKAIMAPRVATGAAWAPETPKREGAAEAPPGAPSLAALRKRIEDTSTYVGDSFVADARAMHAGEAPKKAIHGQASLPQARALLADGVPVLPLPFVPRQKLS